jgi:hypothetical protein
MKLFLSTFFVTFIGFTSLFAQNLVVTVGTSSLNSCDGLAYISDSSAILNNTSIYWFSGGMVVQQGGYSLTNLCAGEYAVTYTNDSLTATEPFTIGLAIGDPCSDFVATVMTTGESSEGACDATAEAFVSGGTAPYSYSWSNGLTNNPQTGLCTGVIVCSVVDVNGCSFSYTATVGNGNANPGDTVIVIDNNVGGSTNGDLGGYFLEDCEVILADIDSAYINGYNYNIGDSSIIILWVVVDVDGQILNQYTTVYGIPDSLNGIYSVSMTIFCQERAGGINTVTINDVIEVTGTAGISESTSNDLLVVNPFNDQLQILHKGSNLRKVELFDMHGKLLLEEVEFSGAETTLNTASIGNGVCLIKMTTDKGITQKRLVKQ